MTELRAVDDRAGRFDALLTRVEAPLRRSLVAAYGPEPGREAAADALAYAWEHLDRLEAMDNTCALAHLRADLGGPDA